MLLSFRRGRIQDFQYFRIHYVTFHILITGAVLKKQFKVFATGLQSEGINCGMSSNKVQTIAIGTLKEKTGKALTNDCPLLVFTQIKGLLFPSSRYNGGAVQLTSIKLMEKGWGEFISCCKQADWQDRKIPRGLSDTKAPSLTLEVLGQRTAGG